MGAALRRRGLGILALALLVGPLACGSSSEATAAADASVADASGGERDAGPGADAGPAADGSTDAGPVGTFPRGFRFGTATAGFQVEMGCPTLAPAQCEDRNSDWYQWITTPRIVNNNLLHMSGDPPSTGPGFRELWASDLDRAGPADLGTSVLRLSLEWSRIFPRPTFGVTDPAALRALADPEALSFYHQVLTGLRQRGMHPSVTVTHYALPLWIHDGNLCNDGVIPGQSLNACIQAGKAGWADPNHARIGDEIAKFAGFLGREFGNDVDEWATMNEPFSAVILPGYLAATEMRSNPPGLTGAWLSVSGAKTAMMSMIEAHAKMYDALKAADRVDADGDGTAANVGLVYSFSKIEPLTGNQADADAAAHADYIFHDLFMDGVAFGRVDPDWDLGPGKGTVRPELANRLDWVGVNYYFGFKAQALRVSPLPGVSPFIDFNPLQGFDGEAPGGLFEVLRNATRYKKPLIVSETGASFGNDQGAPATATPEDERKRAAWFVRTLAETRRATQAGIDVGGFYAWALTDNYEWNHGASMRFGLYAVDPKTKARTPRQAAAVYRRMVRERDVPNDPEQTYLGVFTR